MHSKNLNIAITLLTALAMGCGDDSNSPNKCSEGQVWNAETGKCDPLVTSECTTNDDCKDGKVCKDGACQAEQPLVECTSNDDCKDGKVCKDGACEDSQPIDKCTSNDDCQDGKVCNSGHCETAQPVECQTDDDCNGDLVCKLGKCEPECSQDDDCETPQICRDTRCILECTTDDECDNNLVCRDNRCAPQCQTSEDCNEPLVCRDNACQPECQNDDDCDGGLVCKENKCTEECQNDDDCDDGLVCKENKCTEECQNDDDCDGDLICVDKRCKIECEKKEDCQEGFVCSEQKCIPACISDSDCDESYLCQDEICIKDPLWCSFDSDCESGFYCDKNHCYDPNNQCSQDEDCTDPLVCKENKCVPECKVNADCTDNLVCKSQRCKPECTTNAECTAPKYCKDMRCTKSCSKDSDCLPPYICIDNQCAHECEKTSDCTNDLICSNYRCVACASDSDCGPEQVCNLNVCEISKDIRYPCLPEGNSFKVYKTDSGYNAAQNIDGSINLCKLGYHPSENEILADPSKDKCIALYEARPYDFYGDGIDSNCDGYDYNLKNAIFVASQAQGSEAGDDTHSGNYNQEQNIIEAKATIQSALTHSNVAINVSGTMLTYLPDILVDKSVTSNLANTLQISVTSAQDLNILPPLKAISSAPNKTAYSEHSILVKEVSTDPSKTISDYGFYTEGNHPKERIRIFGGLTRNPLNNSNYHHWQHLNSEDTSKQSYQIPEITEDSYVLVQSVSISTPLSLALSDFEMSLSAKGKSKPEGTTLVGLSCGKAGCISLNLNHTTWTITAPDGISQSGTPDAGEDGYAGKNGNHDEDNTNLYIDSTWCPNEQICSGTTATGTGGCGGHIRKTNKENGDSSSNYDGASLNYIGKTGQAGLSVLSASSVILAAGGKGGAGLTSAGISYKGCNSNMSVDESKGTGEKGGDGAGGKNGSHKNLELTLTPTSDSLAMYFKSNYDSNTEIYGGDGAQGGGGGGGSVYQIHSAMTQSPAWISAGSGGNGGCGGKGGLPGGTGGSAIGLIVLPPQSVNAKISLDNTAFHVIAGSGGKAQNGSDGGKGGAGGSNMGYAKENAISTDIYCEKATAGGDGGNGGGGGAGAGGVAGRALSYLFACNRKVTDDCSLATTSKPCFNATNRTTFANCGIELPMKFVAVYDDSAFGSATPGKTMDDSSETVTQSGGIAGTTQTDGYYRFLTTWIGNL